MKCQAFWEIRETTGHTIMPRIVYTNSMPLDASSPKVARGKATRQMNRDPKMELFCPSWPVQRVWKDWSPQWDSPETKGLTGHSRISESVQVAGEPGFGAVPLGGLSRDDRIRQRACLYLAWWKDDPEKEIDPNYERTDIHK